MAHEIEIANGVASFAFTGDRSAIWHHLGTSVQEAMSIMDALTIGHADYLCELHPLLNPFTQSITDCHGVFRMDTKECIGSGLSSNYAIVQNQEVLNALSLISGIEKTDKLIDTIGVLGKGERCFACIKLNDEVRIQGTNDVQYPYLMAYWSHDGSSKVTFKLVFTRPICANTVSMGLSEHGLELAISHRKNAKDMLNAALKTVHNAHDTIANMNNILNDLASKRITGKGAELVLSKLFGKIDDLEGAARTRAINKQYRISQLFERNDGADGTPEVKDTYYSLLNSIIEYQDFESPIRKTTGRGNDEQLLRADSSLFGVSSDLKTNALKVISEVAAMPEYVSTLRRTINTGASERAELVQYAPSPNNGTPSILDDIIANS